MKDQIAPPAVTFKSLGERDDAQVNALTLLAQAVRISSVWIDGDPEKDTKGARERMRNMEDGLNIITDKLDRVFWIVVGLVITIAGSIIVYVILNAHPQ